MQLRLVAAAITLGGLVLITLLWKPAEPVEDVGDSSSTLEATDTIGEARSSDEADVRAVSTAHQADRQVRPISGSALRSNVVVPPALLPLADPPPVVAAESGSAMRKPGKKVPQNPKVPIAGFNAIVPRKAAPVPGFAGEAGSVVKRKTGVPAPAPVRPEAGSGVRPRGVAAPLKIRLPVGGLRIPVATLQNAETAAVPSTLARVIEFAPGGQQVAVGFSDGEIQIFEAVEGRHERSFRIPSGALFDLHYAPDGTLITLATGSQLRLLDPATGDVVRSFQPAAPLRNFAVTPNGESIVAGCDDGRIVKVSLSTGELTLIGQHGRAITTVTVSPNGRFAATAASDPIVNLWNIDLPAPPVGLVGAGSPPRQLVFSGDSLRLASAGLESGILLWNLEPDRIGVLEKRIASVSSAKALLFDRTARNAFVAGLNAFVHRIDLATGAMSPMTSHAADGSVRDIALSSDGLMLAAIARDGIVTLIQVAPDSSNAVRHREIRPDGALKPGPRTVPQPPPAAEPGREL